MNVILIAAIIVVVLILAGVLIWFVRMKHFKPTRDKRVQQEMLNRDLAETGFAYELRGDYFYSLMDCWQRNMGYCKLYDESAHLFNMIMDCEPVAFTYGGKKWLIELWKGQYGITTGAEIGIYNTRDGAVDTEEFQGTFYEAANDAERMPMSFVLKKNGKTLIKRNAVHWWLTGFKLGEFSEPGSLTMDIRMQFPERGMCFAFVNALKEIGYQPYEYKVRKNEVRIHYDRPHTTQPLTGRAMQKAVVQRTNENNCGLYEVATIRFRDTLDKLEFMKAQAPELYEIFVNSLYGKGLYDMFEWLIDLIHGKQPVPPRPEPPCPIPPRPEPPCPEPEPPCPEPEPPCPQPEPPCPQPEPPCPQPEPPCPEPEPPCPQLEPPCPQPEPPCPEPEVVQYDDVVYDREPDFSQYDDMAYDQVQEYNQNQEYVQNRNAAFDQGSRYSRNTGMIYGRQPGYRNYPNRYNSQNYPSNQNTRTPGDDTQGGWDYR